MKRVPPGIVPVALVAGGFFIGSVVYSVLEDVPADTLHFVRPMYALLDTGFSVGGVLALMVGTALTVFASRAAPRRSSVPLAVGAMLLFAAAVATIDGSSNTFTEPIGRTEGLSDYYADVELVDRFGARGISARWEDAVDAAESIHTVSHPPGPLLLLVAIRGVFGSSSGAIAGVQAVLSVLVLVPAWLLARRLVGERAAMVAVLLLMVAPSPVLHVFLSMDAVYATMLVGAMWLLVRGLAPVSGSVPASGSVPVSGSPQASLGSESTEARVVAEASGTTLRAAGRAAAEASGTTLRAGLGGFATGVITFFTYAAAFVAAFGVIWALWTRGRAAVRPLLVAAAGGVAALLVLWAVFDFNLFAVYAASRTELHEFTNRRDYLYGLVASPVAWLVFAGLPLAGMAARELLVRRPPYLLALLLPLAVFYALPWSLTGIIPLETERTLQFAYPLAAAAAGATFVRWESARGEPQDRTLAVLVGVTAAQTILLEALFFFFW